jgi:hypothetical protein
MKVVAFTLFSIVSSSYGGYVGTFEAMDNSKSIVAANVLNVDSINNGFASELAEIDATIKEVRNQKSNRWTGHLKAQTLSDLGIQKAEIKQRQTSTLLGLKSGMESDKAKDKSTANKEAYLIAFVVVALEIILLFVYNSLWAIHSKIHIEGENLGYILHPSEPTIKIQKSLNTPTQLVASKDAKVGFGSNTPQQSEPTQQKPKPVQVTKCKQPKCNVILDPYKVDRYQKKYCSDPCRLGDYNRRQYEKRISK